MERVVELQNGEAMNQADTDRPFCLKGCRDVYEHVVRCTGEKRPPDPDKYYMLNNMELIEEYDNCHIDNNRYGNSFALGGEYHKPTAEEARRRMALIRSEMLKRMEFAFL